MTKRNIIFNGFLYEAVSNKGFVKDGVTYLNRAEISDDDYKKAERVLKGFGYDVRGIDDLKKLLNKWSIENIDGIDYTKVLSPDWGRTFAKAIGISTESTPVEKENILELFLKNIAKNQDGITISSSINAGTAYILPDGRSVNFPSRGNIRAHDHRIIGGYIGKDFDSATAAMEYFMEYTGAIRYVPEDGSFDIRVKPTNIQLDKIKSIVDRAKIDFSLDVYSDEYGRRGKIYNVETSRGVTGAKVKSDILRFYNSGEFGLEHLGA